MFALSGLADLYGSEVDLTGMKGMENHRRRSRKAGTGWTICSDVCIR